MNDELVITPGLTTERARWYAKSAGLVPYEAASLILGLDPVPLTGVDSVREIVLDRTLSEMERVEGNRTTGGCFPVIALSPSRWIELADNANVSVNAVFREAVEARQARNGQPVKVDKSDAPGKHAHVSDKLAMMNQASFKFWSNADRNDRGTHPDNAMVAAWLVPQGFSPTLADKAATIIRPEWAPTGRKSKE